MRKMITPTLNLNGSDAQTLIDARMLVYTRLDEVISAIYAALPHGRDYQHLIRDNDWDEHRTAVNVARQAFLERVELLREMRNDFVADALAIHKQQEERVARLRPRDPVQLRLVDDDENPGEPARLWATGNGDTE
jgi:hypothetical protein